MRILFIHDYGYKLGGAEAETLARLKAMRDRGFNVKLFTSKSRLNSELVDYSVRSYRTRWIPDFLNPFYYFNLLSFIKLGEVITDFKPDILHYGNVCYELSPSVLCYVKRYPSVMKVHDYSIVCPKSTMNKENHMCNVSFSLYCLKSHCISKRYQLVRYLSQLIRMRLLRYFVNQIKVLITPSNFVGEVVSRVYSNPRVTINNYVSVIKRRPYKVNGDILYIGRLAKEKGVQDLILAFSKVESRLPNRRLVLVGDGNYKQQLIDLTHSLKLERRIMFKGYKADVARYYRNSSLVVVPSQWPEPFGIVIIEAMAYGIPVIATGVGGISEIIKHGNNGYLCKPNDAHILARVILSFFRDTNRMKKMSAAAFNTSKQYSTQKFVAKLSKIYEMLK